MKLAQNAAIVRIKKPPIGGKLYSIIFIGKVEVGFEPTSYINNW